MVSESTVRKKPGMHTPLLAKRLPLPVSHGAQAAARRWDRAFFIFFADSAPERLQKKP